MWDWSESGQWSLSGLPHRTFAPLVLLVLIASLHAQTCAPGEVRVIVMDSQESPVFNAEVNLSSGTTQPSARSTQTRGFADFEGLPCGSWNISVDAQGFEHASSMIEIAGAANKEVRLVLAPKTHTEIVEVKDTVPPVEQAVPIALVRVTFAIVQYPMSVWQTKPAPREVQSESRWQPPPQKP